MAISKDQALRPYVQALGDAFDGMDDIPGQVDEITRSLGQVERSLTDTVNPFINRFRFGTTEDITVEAGVSYSASVIYDVPFDEGAKSLTLIGFADGIVPANVNITIIESNNLGFRYTVYNAGAEAVTISLVYMGVRVG